MFPDKAGQCFVTVFIEQAHELGCAIASGQVKPQVMPLGLIGGIGSTGYTLQLDRATCWALQLPLVRWSPKLCSLS